MSDNFMLFHLMRSGTGNYYLDTSGVMLRWPFATSHCYPERRALFLSLLNLLTHKSPTLFNYISPRPHCTTNTNAGGWAWFISRVFHVLFVCRSVWRSRLFFGCFTAVRPLKEAVTGASQPYVHLLAFSSDLLLPSPLLTLDHWLYSLNLPLN